MSSFFRWVTSPVPRRPAELELPAPAEPPSAPPAEAPVEGYVDRGMTLPDSYGVDIARALVQDPFHLMVYWELRPESVRALEDLFPDGASEFRPTMRLTDLTEGTEAYVTVPLSGKYWFETMPSHQYRADVGAYSPRHGFVPVVRSNVVETPRGTVATVVDDDPKYRVSTPRFARLLEVTGFATDRVMTDLARAEAGITPAQPARLGAPPAAPPPFLVAAFGKLPEPVRAAAAEVARGRTLTRSMIDLLPEQLRAILASFLGTDDEEILTAAFMHLLPQLLRHVLDGGLVDEAAHPVHLPPRFAIGGSDVLQRPHVDWSWMPSMAESLTRRRAPHLEPDALDPIPSA